MTESNVMPPGPEEDPEGWTSSEEVRIGKASCIVSSFLSLQKRELSGSALGQMSLANPLMYTRGTPIHLHLKLTGTPDVKALRIALVQTIQVNGEGIPSRSQKRTGSPTGSVMKTCIASAVCYVRPQDEGTGIVHGEIKVPKDLTPNFVFKNIIVEVSFSVIFFSTPAVKI
jgi:hypothetical protein